MVWHGDQPAMRDAILDPKGAISVYENRRIPTGRRRRVTKYESGFGDLDPVNSRLAALLAGDLEVEELDDEELGYGVPKCDDGKFSIKAAYQASKVPQSIRAKMQKELVRRANGSIAANVMAAIDRIVWIATSPSSDDKDAMKAADWLATRVLGKNPEVVVHTQDKPFEVLIDQISRGSRAESRRARGIVVEGEVVSSELEASSGEWKPPAIGGVQADGISRGRRPVSD